MLGGGLTREVFCHNPWVSPVHTRGKRDVNRALNAAGLLLDSNDGAFCKRMHRFEEQDVSSHIDEQLR
jgi:hypothetical protein